MPRPKIHPNNRQRVVEACVQCRTSKRKCTSLPSPCSQCVRRGLQEKCYFPSQYSKDSGSRKMPRQIAHAQHPADSTPGLAAEGDNLLLDVLDRAGTSPQTPSNSSLSSRELTHGSPTRLQNSSCAVISPGISSPGISSPGTSRGEAPNTTRARMLSNSRGERLFVGGSASLSFLQLVRETVARCIGASEFSENPRRDQMLEADVHVRSHESESVSIEVLAQQEEYINNYFLATKGILNVVDREEARGLFLSSSRTLITPRAALRLLIIAISAQVGSLTESNAQVEKAAMAQAQRIAFAGMLENPSLEMAQIFLLLSFYMLGACQRNAAFMYLGVAARAGHALGLHHADSYSSLDDTKKQPRLNCWKSIVFLDLTVSSILGRTPAISSYDVTGDSSGLNADGANITASDELEAAYTLALRVRGILSEVQDKTMTVEAAEAHLAKLVAWTDTLPPQLRFPGLRGQISTSIQESLLGSLHISCSYYFAVMLVTRPFLISSLSKSPTTPVHGRVEMTPGYGGEDVAVLAAACLNAAVYLSQTCAEVLRFGWLLENMCLLKAWAFAAGLVLGFQLFGGREQDDEIEQAFVSVQDVLKKFSTRSPQAAHYHEILRHLSNAITKQRQMINSRKRKKAGSLVTRLVNLQPDLTHSDDSSGRNRFTDIEQQGPTAYSMEGSPTDTFQVDPELLQQDMSSRFFGWNGSFFALDDQFSFDPGNLEGIPWNCPWRYEN